MEESWDTHVAPLMMGVGVGELQNPTGPNPDMNHNLQQDIQQDVHQDLHSNMHGTDMTHDLSQDMHNDFFGHNQVSACTFK